jgi:hypothetical protein
MTFPEPDHLDDYLLDPTHEAELSQVQARRDSVKAEGVIASKYWGGIQWRIVVTFSVCAVLWATVLVLGMSGTIPLWIGLIGQSDERTSGGRNHRHFVQCSTLDAFSPSSRITHAPPCIYE